LRLGVNIENLGDQQLQQDLQSTLATRVPAIDLSVPRSDTDLVIRETSSTTACAAPVVVEDARQGYVIQGPLCAGRHDIPDEIGNRLLRILTKFDPEIDTIRQEFFVHDKYTEVEFNALRRRLRHYDFTVNPDAVDLNVLFDFLTEKGDLLIRELENPDLIEHEYFTELLWAVVHLRDELVSRESLTGLPESDMAHLANDVVRIYRLLSLQWINYLQYLKEAYPFLFSLALRTNPFVEKPSAIVT